MATNTKYVRHLPSRVSDKAGGHWLLKPNRWCCQTELSSYAAKGLSSWTLDGQRYKHCGKPWKMWGRVVVRRAKANLMGIKQNPKVPINTFRTSQSGDNASPWSVHDRITIMPSCVIIVGFYCLCFMTHFGLLLADTITHDFYSFDDSWPLLWPTINPFLLSVRPTFSNDIYFLYHSGSIFGLRAGFLQSFRWSVCITYPKLSIIYSLVGTCCIP